MCWSTLINPFVSADVSWGTSGNPFVLIIYHRCNVKSSKLFAYTIFFIVGMVISAMLPVFNYVIHSILGFITGVGAHIHRLHLAVYYGGYTALYGFCCVNKKSQRINAEIHESLVFYR